MQLWDTAHGTRVLLEVLLGEGYEQELRELAYAIEEADAIPRQDNSRGTAEAWPEAEARSESERHLTRAQNILACRLTQSMTRLLDPQVVMMVTVPKNLALGD